VALWIKKKAGPGENADREAEHRRPSGDIKKRAQARLHYAPHPAARYCHRRPSGGGSGSPQEI